MAAELSLEAWLALADVALLASAAFGYVLMRRTKPAASLDVKAAYGVLDRTIARYLPDLDQGYTWREALERLKWAGVKADWDVMKQRLSEYEAYRYGGREAPTTGQEDVISLAAKLRRGVVGKRTKAESPQSG